ncbi:MAG TPA: polar amino acid ABC transporter permease, partial [Clostridium sp.]|nr:polar amino acid ABC transporter permease [Clostridium sp.]
MDIDFILKNIPLYIKATQLTLTLAFWGVVLSVLIGFICSLIIYYKVKVLRHIV